MERIEMSKKEIGRLEVVGRVGEGHIRPAEAARMLALSERQVRRLRRRYEHEGAGGLVSKRRGKPSNRHLPYSMMEQVLAKVRASSPDSGPTLAAEYLRGDGFVLSKEACAPA